MSISIEELKKLAENLLFDMSEEQYQTLQDEFEVILKQMKLLAEIPNIDDVEPLVFPVESPNMGLREDEPEDCLRAEEVLENAKDKMMGMIKVQKVVG